MIKILIVDDNIDFNDLLYEALTMNGDYSVDKAYDGQEAFKLAIEKNYDLILMDLQMPMMSGEECVLALYQANPLQKFFIISGDITEEIKEKLKEFGAVEFISKPVKFTEITSKIEKYFS